MSAHVLLNLLNELGKSDKTCADPGNFIRGGGGGGGSR